ncbi:MAG: hypothetical protein ACKV2V_01260 [Blastocatellia bacterium]
MLITCPRVCSTRIRPGLAGRIGDLPMGNGDPRGFRAWPGA